MDEGRSFRDRKCSFVNCNAYILPRRYDKDQRLNLEIIGAASLQCLHDYYIEKVLKTQNVVTLCESFSLDGKVVGVEFQRDGKTYKEYGPVIIATGGFAADFSKTGILASVRAVSASSRVCTFCMCCLTKHSAALFEVTRWRMLQ